MTRRQRQRAAARRNIIAEYIVGALCALLITFVTINWITGCGTFTRTIDGKIIHGKCVGIPAFAITTPQ